MCGNPRSFRILIENFPSFKHRVICYLVSHAVACKLPQVRASILKSLKDVSDASKAPMLVPVFKHSFGTSEYVTIPAPADQEFLLALARAFDKNAAKALNDKEGELWQIFVRVLQTCLAKGECHVVSDPCSINQTSTGTQYFLNIAFEEALRGGLFQRLSFERQVTLCQLLLDLGGVAEAVWYCAGHSGA